MTTLKAKVAFITGAGAGIGRATALNLAAKQARVMVTDINEEAGKETVDLIRTQGGYAQFYTLDVAHKAQIDQVIDQILTAEGALDLAVNNAGIGGVMKALHDVKEEDWMRMITVNLSGLFYCMQAEIKCMLTKGGGRIVNVASLAGINGVAYGGPYVAAKHGVIGLTKTAALEYGALNIRVNAVCPGFVKTAILDNLPEEILNYSTQIRVPLKRIGQPAEVAQAITWLLSEDASYVNGHLMLLDGGFKAG